MPYIKPTVHLSRLAGTALKSFSHSAHTVVAASQYHGVQNTDTLIGRFRKNERSKLHSAFQNAEGARQTSTAAGRSEAGQQDPGLDKYFDAWQSHQRNEAKEWQQFQFAKRIEWQPPTTVPNQTQEGTVQEESQLRDEVRLIAPGLKRSYTTSALDNFGKASNNDAAAEAVALEQVNIAIAQEIQRSKEAVEEAVVETVEETAAPTAVSQDAESIVSKPVSSPATIFTSSDSLSSVSSVESEYFTKELLQLAEHQQHDRIPAAFQAMLRAGVQQPSQAAYRALLSSAIELKLGKHQQIPRALEVYSDMLKRKVTPDTATFGILIDLLATRAIETVAMRKSMESRLARYGGLEKPGMFMFRSTQLEHAMIVEDSSLSIALKLFGRASSGAEALSSRACAALVVACAEHGVVEDMTRLYEHMVSRAMRPQSTIFPSMISAFGEVGDMRRAVEVYDDYKDLAIANNDAQNEIDRVDTQVYTALVKAYGSADKLSGGLKFLSSVQDTMTDPSELGELQGQVAVGALLPLALKDQTFRDAFDLTQSLSGLSLVAAMSTICTSAADKNRLEVSVKAFDMLANHTQDLAGPSMAMLAMHVRNANVDAAEPYWRILETAPANLTFAEPTTMRAVALIGQDQAERGLRQSRRMFGRIRDQQAESGMTEAVGQIDEALELMGTFMLKSASALRPEASAEWFRMMSENGGLIVPVAEHLLARLGPEQIARLNPTDLETFLRVQAGMILDDVSADIAGPARFSCLLENIISRSMMPATDTETLIEKTLINIDRTELSSLWNGYRYPQTPVAFTPVLPFQRPAPVPVQPAFDEAHDPYAARTDIKGSNAINELLERPQGRRMQDALTKFRNMRRVGRAPRMFTYGKLIESAAKENNLTLAHDILEMAKQDVPFDARYRVVRFGWQQILDHMVAGCLTVGRRDLAARYHQDLLDMGAAPSANTFGLYITTLKENTKTFDEASEAVKIFQRAKTEGVEPSSFLYNALIGKLGKARRIDDSLFYFAEMRNLGVRPTSVTYGTVVNALCRVSDEKFAEEIFEEMESCSNYKPRPAPYHSLMQFFLSTKRDRGKVLAYYERMRSKGIEPTVHTYKLLIDTHATLEPVNMPAAEAVLEEMHRSGAQVEAVHYASLIHAKGCVQHDVAGARALFDSVVADNRMRPQPCMYQALFESFNANRLVASETEALLADMNRRHVEFTPYIANALIHGWTLEKDITKSKEAFQRVSVARREPSTYEAMVWAYLAAEDREGARGVVREALGRGYPSAVAGKIAELVR